jgi:hypothetical protein
MKLGLIIASIALAALTGCAAEEETQAPKQEEPSEETKAPQVKVEEASAAQPQMMCKSWGYLDGKRVCLY